jgi:hypothetical protein
VDPEVGRHLYEQVVCGFLAGKTRVLVTHQVQHLKVYTHVLSTIAILDVKYTVMYVCGKA